MTEHSAPPRADDGHLDGNAAGGLLRELFAVDVTAADATCVSCGTIGAVGALLAYGHRMGAVLRCARCGTAMLRVTRTSAGHWLDLRGARVVRIPAVGDTGALASESRAVRA